MDRKITTIIILTGIILFHIINNFIWLKNDTSYLTLDAHGHYLFSLAVFQEIQDNIIPLLSNVLDRVIYQRWHGVFVGYITAPFYFIFGTGQDAGTMINTTIFLIVLVLSTYGIGKLIFSRKAGLISAFIVTMYPMVFIHLKIYMLDLPLTSMLTLSIYLLLLTNNLTSRRYILIFAISAGLGMITKFNFAGFIIGPLTVILLKSFMQSQNYRKKIIFYNVLIVLCIAFILSFLFFELKFWEVFSRIYGCSWLNSKLWFGRIQKSPVLYKTLLSFMTYWFFTGFEHILWCLQEMVNNILSFFFSAIFFVSFVSLLRKKFEYKNILYVWIILPLLFLSFLFHYISTARYLMPIVPAIAIISGAEIANIKFRPLRRLMIISVALFGCFQYFAVSYNASFLPERLEVRLPDRVFGKKINYIHRDNYLCNIRLLNRKIYIHHRSGHGEFSYPLKEDWKIEEILKEVLKNSDVSGGQVSVFFTDCIPGIYEPIAYHCFAERLPVNINIISLAEEEAYKQTSSPLNMIVTSDFVIMRRDKENYTSLNPFIKTNPLIERRINAARRFLKLNISSFKLIREFELPDGNPLWIFKNKEDYTNIAKGDLSLRFRNGVTRINYKGIELTKDLGLETSFHSGGIEYASAGAIWNIEKIGDGKIVAFARQEGVPVYQKWELEVLDGNRIAWKVRMNIIKKIEINAGASALMLTEQYKRWVSPESKDKFSKDNVLIYKRIILPESEEKYIGVEPLKRKQLPKILFSSISDQFVNIPCAGWRKDIRTIGFIAPGDKYILFPGEYNFFSGEILIDDKHSGGNP